MMWVELHDNTVLVRLDGRFVGSVAENARSLIARCRYPFQLVVDLSEVDVVDPAGEEALLWMSLLGGEFIARSFYALNVCERLHLPLTDKFSQADDEVANALEGLGEPTFAITGVHQ